MPEVGDVVRDEVGGREGSRYGLIWMIDAEGMIHVLRNCISPNAGHDMWVGDYDQFSDRWERPFDGIEGAQFSAGWVQENLTATGFKAISAAVLSLAREVRTLKDNVVFYNDDVNQEKCL